MVPVRHVSPPSSRTSARVGGKRDTLYFNAFTEDLFTWDNDLERDTDRSLRINKASRFFDGLDDLEMDIQIKDFLNP